MVSGRTTGRRSFAVARSNTGLLAPCDGPARCRTPLTLMPRSVPPRGPVPMLSHRHRLVKRPPDPADCLIKPALHVWAGEPAGAMACSSPAWPGTPHAGRVMRHKKKTGEGRGWSAKVNGGGKTEPHAVGWPLT